MPRPKAATVPRLDPLAEIRQLRARQAALQDDLRAKRERLLAEVVEIDEALADLGGVGARAVAALVPKPAQAPSAPRQPKATAARAPEAKGIRAGDPVAAELVELLPWIDALKNDRQRQAIRLRAGGMSPAAVAAKLGCSNKDVGNDVMRGRKSMREARSKGKPGETPASDDEPAPAHPAPPVNDNAAPVSSEPPQQPAARVPTGWDRSDPDEDFADIAPAAEESPAQSPAPSDVAPSREDEIAGLRAWFGAVNPETIQAVEMTIAGVSVPDIATRLNRSERSVAIAVGTAVRWLRDYRVRYPAGLPSSLEWNRTRLRIINPDERARTIAPRKLRAQVDAGADVDYPDVERPRTRGDCQDMPRPCPFVSCSHHLYLDVNPDSGAIKLNFPHLEVDQMAETCSLDVADRGGITLEEVGAILNLTRERIRQVEVMGISKMQDGHFENAPDRLGSPLAEAIEG